MTTGVHLRIDRVTKRFGAVTALDDVTLEVGEGEFLCIVGPSNAGKSTLLKTIAGIHRPESGTVTIRGRDVTHLDPRERRVSLLFQNIALFPNRTGFENIAFPLSTAGLPSAEIKRRVLRLAGMLGIAHVMDRHPRTYSGGEQQRVAIGRAIALESDLLMLDEPLSNLDARIRIATRLEFKRLRAEMAGAILYVTHDHIEAMSLGDRVAVLQEGRIQQIGAPDEVYRFPVNKIVARLFGSPPMNTVPVHVSGLADKPHLVGNGFSVAIPNLGTLSASRRLPDALELGLHAEAIRVQTHQSPETPFPANVFRVEQLGNKAILDLRLGDDTVKATVSHDHPVSDGGAVWIGFKPDPRHLIDRDSGRFLR